MAKSKLSNTNNKSESKVVSLEGKIPPQALEMASITPEMTSAS